MRLALTTGRALRVPRPRGRDGAPSHLALHPFGRVPILDHAGFKLYETAAIAVYVDEAFTGPALQPTTAQGRRHASVDQLAERLLSQHRLPSRHERLIYPSLGIAPDEKVVAVALPKIATGLDIMERELGQGRAFLVDDRPTLADFFLLPTLTTLSLTPEGQAMLASRTNIAAWRQRLEALPSVMAVRAMVMPHLGQHVEHSPAWVDTHRPRY